MVTYLPNGHNTGLSDIYSSICLEEERGGGGKGHTYSQTNVRPLVPAALDQVAQ